MLKGRDMGIMSMESGRMEADFAGGLWRGGDELFKVADCDLKEECVSLMTVVGSWGSWPLFSIFRQAPGYLFQTFLLGFHTTFQFLDIFFRR